MASVSIGPLTIERDTGGRVAVICRHVFLGSFLGGCPPPHGGTDARRGEWAARPLARQRRGLGRRVLADLPEPSAAQGRNPDRRGARHRSRELSNFGQLPYRPAERVNTPHHRRTYGEVVLRKELVALAILGLLLVAFVITSVHIVPNVQSYPVP
jgi:hypothetical protein